MSLKTFFHDANSQIVEAVAGILAGYYAEIKAGMTTCVHEQDEMDAVEDLLARFRRLKGTDFADLKKCATWLHDVAGLLPKLWD